MKIKLWMRPTRPTIHHDEDSTSHNNEDLASTKTAMDTTNHLLKNIIPTGIEHDGSRNDCDVDFTSFLPKDTKDVSRKGRALVLWWRNYQEPGLLRKNPDCSVNELSGEVLRIRGDCDKDAVKHKIRSSMKKIKAEDLGDMQASDLLASIPEEDPQGRGLQDLRKIEKKLSVKIVFDEEGGHVYLVGDAKKLEKKVFTMRNLISHYHWRLSGKDVSSSMK